jgi:hypothetical protein
MSLTEEIIDWVKALAIKWHDENGTWPKQIYIDDHDKLYEFFISAYNVKEIELKCVRLKYYKESDMLTIRNKVCNLFMNYEERVKND